MSPAVAARFPWFIIDGLDLHASCFRRASTRMTEFYNERDFGVSFINEPVAVLQLTPELKRQQPKVSGLRAKEHRHVFRPRAALPLPTEIAAERRGNDDLGVWKNEGGAIASVPRLVSPARHNASAPVVSSRADCIPNCSTCKNE